MPTTDIATVGRQRTAGCRDHSSGHTAYYRAYRTSDNRAANGAGSGASGLYGRRTSGDREASKQSEDLPHVIPPWTPRHFTRRNQAYCRSPLLGKVEMPSIEMIGHGLLSALLDADPPPCVFSVNISARSSVLRSRRSPASLKVQPVVGPWGKVFINIDLPPLPPGDRFLDGPIRRKIHLNIIELWSGLFRQTGTICRGRTTSAEIADCRDC
jgi:hypothetical protein